MGSENVNPLAVQLEESEAQVKSLNCTAVAGISSKILPPKQLRDIITDIFASKLRFDQKAAEMGQPVETMEQYMYTYLV